jgi:hypothetical protein
MKHIEFLIWMLAWPLVETLCDIARYRWYRREARSPSDDITVLASLITMLFYVVVGYALWTTAT